jgi:hypothetical protein
LAGLPYTALRDAVIAHPTMSEGLIPLFGNVLPISAHAAKRRNAECSSPEIRLDTAWQQESRVARVTT